MPQRGRHQGYDQQTLYRHKQHTGLHLYLNSPDRQISNISDIGSHTGSLESRLWPRGRQNMMYTTTGNLQPSNRIH